MQRTACTATRNRRPKRTAPQRSLGSLGEGLAALRCPIPLHTTSYPTHQRNVLGAALPAGFGMAGCVPQGNLALCLERKAKARFATRTVGQSITPLARGASHPPRISALSALAIVQRFVPGGWSDGRSDMVVSVTLAADAALYFYLKQVPSGDGVRRRRAVGKAAGKGDCARARARVYLCSLYGWA